MKWIKLALILIAFLATLMLLASCQKEAPRNPLPEDQLLDPINEGCTLPQLSLEYYSLIGERKLARMKTRLLLCREGGHIEPGSEIESLDAIGVGLNCPNVRLAYYQLILKEQLSRAVRDLIDCRSHLTIPELE